jgi:hypothetical protein
MPSIYLNHVKVAEESGGIVSLPNTVQFNNLKIGGTEVINSNRQIQNITGIDFGSGSVLNDYEEGTWTPTVGGTSTYTVQSGSYTKIGRMVYLNFDMRINELGTGSSIFISAASLPFTFVYAGSARAAGSINWFNALAISRDAFYLEIDGNGIYLGSNSGASNTINETGAFGNGAGIMASIWYTTSA